MPQPIMGVEFGPPRFPTLGLEVLRLSDLRRRAPPEHFQCPQRPAFHVLLLFGAGEGWHSLDFETLACAPGTIVHVRPGQVQQFDMRDDLDATVILFRPDFPLLDTSAPEALLVDRVVSQGVATLSGSDLLTVADDFAAMARSHARADGTPASAAILQHLLQVLLLRLTCVAEGTDAEPHAGNPHLRIFRRFRKLIEARFADGWKVADYASELALSEKTLSRICCLIGGNSPAKFIHARLVLEAKRLLAHSDLTSAAIAATLGFDEPTNFTKFFRRMVGTTPANFRRTQRNTA